jgi:ubiquinone/menaquinone biosynthesis C-methylase UbiE
MNMDYDGYKNHINRFSLEILKGVMLIYYPVTDHPPQGTGRRGMQYLYEGIRNSMSDTKRNFNKDAASWDQNPLRVKLANDVFTAISARVPLNASMRVMDFGCGTGLLTLGVAPFVGTVTGVDSSRGMLDVLRIKISDQKINNTTTSFLDLEKGDTLAGSYNLIVSSMTLHHVERIGPILEQFYRCLVSDGYLCIADLDPDEGLFHDDKIGVFHSGFERTAMGGAFVGAGFDRVTDATAAEVVKTTSNGEMRRFTVFLMTGQKAARI